MPFAIESICHSKYRITKIQERDAFAFWNRNLEWIYQIFLINFLRRHGNGIEIEVEFGQDQIRVFKDILLEILDSTLYRILEKSRLGFIRIDRRKEVNFLSNRNQYPLKIQYSKKLCS